MVSIFFTNIQVNKNIVELKIEIKKEIDLKVYLNEFHINKNDGEIDTRLYL